MSDKIILRALVLADLNKKRLCREFPNIQFDFFGYAENFNVLPHDELVNIISDYDILVSEFDTIGKDVLDHAKTLKLLVCCRGGIQSVVDIPEVERKGIMIRNTPGRNSRTVAEYVIGQIISVDRHFADSNQMIHDEILQKQKFKKPAEYKDSLWGMDYNSPYHIFRGKGLQNIKLGIIGYGKVGSVVADMAVALGMKVMVYDHSAKDFPVTIEAVSLDKLLKECDFVSLHCNNKNHKVVIGRDEFNKMKNDAVFINTARGDLVDEDELVKALDDGIIGGAVIDVTRHEPLQVGDKLIKAKNLVITPHIAGAADVVIGNGTQMVIDAIHEFFDIREMNY